MGNATSPKEGAGGHAPGKTRVTILSAPPSAPSSSTTTPTYSRRASRYSISVLPAPESSHSDNPSTDSHPDPSTEALPGPNTIALLERANIVRRKKIQWQPTVQEHAYNVQRINVAELSPFTAKSRSTGATPTQSTTPSPVEPVMASFAQTVSKPQLEKRLKEFGEVTEEKLPLVYQRSSSALGYTRRLKSHQLKLKLLRRKKLPQPGLRMQEITSAKPVELKRCKTFTLPGPLTAPSSPPASENPKNSQAIQEDLNSIDEQLLINLRRKFGIMKKSRQDNFFSRKL